MDCTLGGNMKSGLHAWWQYEESKVLVSHFVSCIPFFVVVAGCDFVKVFYAGAFFFLCNCKFCFL